MSFLGFGDEALFDFNGDGKLDLFETALMLNEQDREMNEILGRDKKNQFDSDDEADDLGLDGECDCDDDLGLGDDLDF